MSDTLKTVLVEVMVGMGQLADRAGLQGVLGGSSFTRTVFTLLLDRGCSYQHRTDLVNTIKVKLSFIIKEANIQPLMSNQHMRFDTSLLGTYSFI